MNKRSDNRAEKYQDAADARDRSEHCMHDCRHNVEKKPGAAEDDRLHRIKAHKIVLFFEDIENNAADQWNASNGRSYVRRQTGRCWRRARPGPGSWRRRRWNGLLVWHDLHTQTSRSLVKQTCLLQFLFGFHCRIETNIVAS